MPMVSVDSSIIDELRELREKVSERDKALRLVLIFYKLEWSAQDQAVWRATTDKNEATTKVLCDHVRRVLGVDENEGGAK